MLSCFNHVQLLVTPWTIAHQASLSMGFSKQEYWSELPCPTPGDLPDPGIEPMSLMSPALTEAHRIKRHCSKTVRTYSVFHEKQTLINKGGHWVPMGRQLYEEKVPGEWPSGP